MNQAGNRLPVCEGLQAAAVLTLDSSFRIHPINVYQIPADQIPGAVHTVGAVNADQRVYRDHS